MQRLEKQRRDDLVKIREVEESGSYQRVHDASGSYLTGEDFVVADNRNGVNRHVGAPPSSMKLILHFRCDAGAPDYCCGHRRCLWSTRAAKWIWWMRLADGILGEARKDVKLPLSAAHRVMTHGRTRWPAVSEYAPGQRSGISQPGCNHALRA